MAVKTEIERLIIIIMVIMLKLNIGEKYIKHIIQKIHRNIIHLRRAERTFEASQTK